MTTPQVFDEILSNLRSIATTNAQTLDSLRNLLGLQSVNHSEEIDSNLALNENVAKKGATVQDGLKSVAAKSAKRARQNPPNFKIHESSACDIKPLSALKRRRAATEFFNTSLKCLTDAVKTRQNTLTKTTISSVSVQPRNSKAAPLQPCSPNKQSKIRSKSAQSTDHTSMVADCAISALHCLRESDSPGDNTGTESYQRLERGALVLIEKLVSLGLSQKAIVEISKVYDQYWKRRKDCAKSDTCVAHSHERAQTAQLRMMFDIASATEDDVTFIINYQSQVLRLAILLGTTTITDSFIENMKLTSKSSPASVIIESHRRGYISDEKAGEQLRIVGQALLKLYSVVSSDKQVNTTMLLLNFSLLKEALTIKCKSWTLLKHNADLDREYWALILKALMRLEASIEENDCQSTKGIVQSIQDIGTTLHSYGFAFEIPADVANIVVNMAERTNSYRDGIDLLNLCNQSSPLWCSEDRIVLSWQLVVLQYKHSDAVDEQFLQYLQHALKSSTALSGPIVKRIDNLLLNGARLRKVIVLVIRDSTSKVQTESDALQDGINTISYCLRVLSQLAHMLGNIAHSTVVSEATEKTRLALTTFAKTFEIVFEIAKQCDSDWPGLQEQPHIELDRCVQAGRLLVTTEDSQAQNCQVIRFLENLLVQISNFYWTRFAEQKSQSVSEQESLKSIQTSCSVVKNLPAKVQKSAAYGMKLEKLALANLSMRKYSDACQIFEEAIHYFITSGALKEAAEIALTGRSVYVWHQKGTTRYSLGKAIVSLTKLRLTYGIVDSVSSSWVLDIRDLSALEQSLVFEAQISAITDHSFSLEEKQAFAKHVQKTLTSCSTADLLVYRLRFLSETLRLTNLNKSCSEFALIDQTTFRDVLESSITLSGDNTPLSSYRQPFIHLLWIQWSLQADQVDTDLLLNHGKSLCSIISKFQDEESLQSAIDDTEIVAKQLYVIVDFARMSDDTGTMINCLSTLKHGLMLSTSPKGPQILNVMTQLADQYRHNADMSEAGKLFAAAEQWIDNSLEDATAQVRWALSYTEYLFEVLDVTKAMAIFDRAAALFRAQNESDHTSSRRQLSKEPLISESALVASKMAFQIGDLQQANHCARQAVKISTQLWQVVERSLDEGGASLLSDSDTSVQGLVTDLSNLTLSFDQSSVPRNSKGTKYWSYVDLHRATLHQMIIVSMHNGLYQDAAYYTEQLRKIAVAIRSKALMSRALVLSALVQAKSGHREEAIAFLRDVEVLPVATSSSEDWKSLLHQAEALIEIEKYTEAIATLDTLDAFIFKMQERKESVPSTTSGIKKPPVRGRAKSTTGIKNPAKRPGRQMAIVEKPNVVSADTRLTGLQRYLWQRSSALRHQVALLQEDVTIAPTNSPGDLAQNANSSSWTVMNAMNMLQQAMSELSSDAVKCVLAETAVALPVRYRSSRKSGRISFIQAENPPVSLKKTRNVRGKASASNPANMRQELSRGEKLIHDAQRLLHDFQSTGIQTCASDVMHMAYRLKSKLALLSSTMSVPLKSSSSELVFQSLLPKDIVQGREKLTITAERATRNKDQMLAWPDIKSVNNEVLSSSAIDYNMDDLAEIPEAWSIITVSLADDQQELLVSKITSTRSPFMLRIPLSRSDYDLDEEHEFTFVNAKEELRDIVAEANASAHDPRGQGDRETRKEWYAEREDLDRRLETWLYNVENIWFGGFRGLMSSTTFDEEVLSGFGQSLNRILNKHLPSRQKSGVQGSNKVALHSHVLELFLGLGDPDERELDDAVTDLLYFVVDILQFSGEHNAYDEIDFDAMLVDVFDAMRVGSNAQSSHELASRHTILIIDKEMASFPWESLQCLRKQSVSRMPSLGSVFCRLRKIKEQAVLSQGYTIPADDGAYVLNPSSDLRSTQDTFQPILQSQLPNYSSTINRAPTESEFTSLLTTKQLLLYFGHGSGAQYIRGRTIRNLDNCAVTLLMGCSSAKMTECGKFESYGMPGYYVGGMSGCMAVVGTLWDVTDRDIDRFALRTMVEWGLISEDEVVAKALQRSSGSSRITAGRSKNKDVSRVSTLEERRGVVSLDRAVNVARDACLLKYLNGAAPVVYGVPVFLR